MARSRRLALALLSLALLSAPESLPPAHAQQWSPEYQDELRKTIEQRRQRRATRAAQPVGTIVPWPMPPALIVRQTSETHDEIRSLLRLLRGQ